MAKIFPTDFEEKLTIAQDDYILFSDSEDNNKIKKAQYSNLKGEQGDPGTAATITVGTVSTGAPGSSATVTNSGTSTAAVLDFSIPQGTAGTDGAAATITAGTTSTLSPGSSATVSNSGTSSAAVFNFGIPKGDKGDQGNPGQDGADGNGITSVTSSKVGKTTTVTMNFDEGDPYSFQVKDGEDGVGGDVFGPSSSTDGHLAVFDGTTGKLLKDGGAMPAIPTKVSDLDNDSGFITGINSGDVTTALGYTPADSASLGTAATKNTGTSSGNVPVLDSNGKLANSTLPGVALTDTFTVSTSSDLTSLSSAEQGDLAIVTSENKTYVLSQAPYSTASNWKQILSPTGGVTSVNGQTGAVTVSEFTPGGTATTGYVVTKTASGYEWQAPTGGIQLAPNSTYTIKYHWYGTQAEYEALNQYYTDTANDTAYFTI